MKKILYLLFLTFTVSYSQNQASNWYFGDNAGINFDNNTGAVSALTNGLLRTDEGCTSISDNDGNLLFYTDGITVYNRLHQQMNNGNNLFGNPSSAQSAIIIPKPEDPNIYYIFTQGTSFSGQADRGFNYSEVDMTLDGGFGGVVTTNKNVPLLNENNNTYIATEKLSAVLKDCQSGNILVVTLVNDLGGNDLFYVYEVSNSGIALLGQPSSAGVTTTGNGRGYLKISPDGTKLVSANIRDGLYLYDFDVITGSVTNPQQLIINTSQAVYAYGIEFSANSQVLYVSTYNDFFSSDPQQNNNPNNHNSALIQYDVSLNDITAINASQTELEFKQGYRSALQLGPDGKIYKTESSTYNIGLPNLSTIGLPNNIGTTCNYQLNTVSLNGRNARQGLPPFISSFFIEKIDITSGEAELNNLSLCNGDTFTLVAENITGATYTWSLDNNAIPTPTPPNELLVSTNGNYEVVIEIPGNDCDSKEGQAIVTYYDIPIAYRPNPILICDDNNDDIWSFNFTTQDVDVLDTQNATTYSVHYYRNQQDADDDENEITGPFENTENPQTIFARIHNNGNTNCYDTTSFEITIFDTPTANPVDNFPTCDDDVDGDDTNGQINVLLTDFNDTVLDSQSETDYTVTYHNLLADASTGSPSLPDTYYIQDPFNETIFVRIENKLNTECYDTTSFDVIVNPLPDRFPSNLFQCDEDGTVDGRTVFNLTEAEDDLTGSATNVSVTYYSLLIDAQNVENEVDPTNFPNTSNPQIIYALVQNTTTECTAITELTLEVSTTQILDYNADPVCDELDSEDGINTFNLDDFTTNIQTINGITFPITYYENYNDALIEQNELTSPYTSTTPYLQNIYARAEDDNACYGISEVTIVVNKLPELLENETVFYCLNKFPETITLKSGVVGNPSDYTYEWTNGETTNEIQINEIGDYTVTVTNANGCEKSRIITVEPSNIATIDAIEILDAVSNNTIIVNASGEGEYEYALFNDAGLYAYYQTSNTFTNVAPGGIYTVSVRDIKNGCGIVEEIVSVIGFPKFFTPNNDGVNDFWQVYGVSSVFQPNSKIKIYNRFGKLLKQISPTSQGWDGTFNGENLPNDDYWFAVTLQDGREYFNHFTLKR